MTSCPKTSDESWKVRNPTHRKSCKTGVIVCGVCQNEQTDAGIFFRENGRYGLLGITVPRNTAAWVALNVPPTVLVAREVPNVWNKKPGAERA